MDLRLFKQINKFSGRLFPVDFLMIFISNRARYVYFFIVVMLLFKGRKNKRIAIETGSSVLLSLILQFFLKLFYKKPRPFVKRRVWILIPSKNDSTFPSKHTTLAFAASTSVLMFHRKLGTIMMWISALTGFSRVWVGHHYPSDVVGSAILGSLTSLVTRIISFTKFRIKPTVS